MRKRIVISPKFKQRVKETGLTQEALAKAIGVSRQTFNRILNGKETPTANFMAGALTAGLGKKLTDIAVWQPDNNDTEQVA